MFVGVDCGTGSVRAALMDATGKCLDVETKEILNWTEPNFHHREQSSENTWEAVVEVVRKVSSPYSASIVGIGFCATCSLVALDENFKPISISTTGDRNRNVILWADHRASLEADEINSKHFDCLKYVGGKVSAEMEIPKILFLKRNLKHFDDIKHFIELPDFLTHRATGCSNPYRSFCSLVCKFNYLGRENKWDHDFLSSLSLNQLAVDGKLGKNVLCPGDPIPGGLSSVAACQLGLKQGIAVATSIIDAHSGAIGLFGQHFRSSIAIISGTSSCVIGVSRTTEVFVEGIWGPYLNAVLPGSYCNEAGQSAAGQLLDYIIFEAHPAKAELKNVKDPYAFLHELLKSFSRQKMDYLTRNFHMTPDFNGNRSPIGKAEMTGMVSGYTLHDSDLCGLSLSYLAAVQALCYGTKMIVDKLNDSDGYDTTKIVGTGSCLVKGELYAQQLANVLQLPVYISSEEAVLRGACILAAKASGVVSSIEEGMEKMSCEYRIFQPDVETCGYHKMKYRIFCEMTQANARYVDFMKSL